MEITRQSKLMDVLDAYPELEAQIINIAPPFKNLKNPVLRRTVGKLATLEKVAQVGGISADELVNKLRKMVGQAELNSQPADQPVYDVQRSAGVPAWIVGQPAHVIDGTELLARGEVPLVKVNELLAKLAPGQYVIVVTNFEPTPIMDAMSRQNRRVFHEVRMAEEEQHWTYIGV